jgi:hypothetical protein
MLHALMNGRVTESDIEKDIDMATCPPRPARGRLRAVSALLNRFYK